MEEQRQLDQWLAESEEHQRLYRTLLAKDDLVGQYHLYMSHAPEEAWQRFSARIDSAEQKPAGKLHLLYHIGKVLRAHNAKWIAAAIVGVLLAVGGYQLYDSRPVVLSPVPVSHEIKMAMQQAEDARRCEATVQIGQEKPRQVRSLTALLKTIAKAQDVDGNLQGTITTRHGKEFWTTLPDGTRVHLNSNSRISYPLAFEGDVREVALVGEAYFIVAKDKTHPFVVHTAQADIREYGTEFNVSTQAHQTNVVLVNGSIGVKSKNGTERMMTPGDKADVSLQGVTMSKVDVAPYVAWNTGHFSFDDCTLEQLMQVVGRWYGDEVEFASSPLRKVRFTGSLSRYETIDNTLEVIATIANVRIERQEAKIIISKK